MDILGKKITGIMQGRGSISFYLEDDTGRFILKIKAEPYAMIRDGVIIMEGSLSTELKKI